MGKPLTDEQRQSLIDSFYRQTVQVEPKEKDVNELLQLFFSQPIEFSERLFTLEEMKACALAMANWGGGMEGTLTPTEYFKETFGIDISK